MKYLFLLFIFSIMTFAEQNDPIILQADNAVNTIYLDNAARKKVAALESPKQNELLKDQVGKRIKFTFIYSGRVDKNIHDLYLGDYPLSRYAYLRLEPLLERIDQNLLPIVINERSKKRLIDQLKSITNESKIVIYGKVDRVRPSRDLRRSKPEIQKNEYYVINAEDIFIPKQKEVVNEIEATPEEITLSVLSAEPKKFVGKHIKFESTFGRRLTALKIRFAPGQDNYDNARYLQLEMRDRELQNLTILASRSDSNLFSKENEYSTNDKIMITGVLRTVPRTLTANATDYMLIVTKIEKTYTEIKIIVEPHHKLNVPESTIDKWEY